MTSLEMSDAAAQNDNDLTQDVATEIHKNTSTPAEQIASPAPELVIWPAAYSRGSSLRLVRNPLATADVDTRD